jgi:opacity protein-like surface antigen
VSRQMGRMLLPVVLSALGASAHAGGLDLRFGGYFPSASSNLFEDVTSLYTRQITSSTAIPPGVQKSDWQGFFGGIEYNQKIANNVELAVSVDGYSKTLDTSYREYVNADDRPIQQRLQLSVIPVGLSVRLVPTSRRARVAPFAVVGVDAMVYQYEEWGDFIDFFDPDRPIVTDSFVSDSVAFGFHVGGGLRVAVGDDFAIVGEGRYYWSETDMKEDFSQNRIDLGGWAATVGFHVRF